MIKNPLPSVLFTPEQARELDRQAMETQGIAGLYLMERAGTAVFTALRQRWPEARRVTVLCGGGNNGGDGYVVARLAHLVGMQVQVLGDPPDKLRGDARATYEYYRATGGTLLDAPVEGKELDFLLAYTDVVVDAVFGTGLDRDIHGRWREVIRVLNDSGKPVIAVDIPSGLNGRHGAVQGIAVHARMTVTFIGLKPGLFTGHGPDCAGEVRFDDLGVPESAHHKIPPFARRLDGHYLATHLSARPRGTHKGNNGHVLLIGGDRGYSGAIRMAASGALRAGAGLVSVATRAAHADWLNLAVPELMCHGVETPEELVPLLDRANVVVIGPGLGQSPWAQSMFTEVADLKKPVIADADALNLVARFGWDGGRETVFTPHPGEAARLLQSDTARVQKDRFSAALTIMDRFGCICVLKGAGTLISIPDETPALCNAGNPGMACGGSGDVLAGVIAALRAQGHSLGEAAKAGVCLHAHAGDLAARHGERGMAPGDILDQLRLAANPLLSAGE